MIVSLPAEQIESLNRFLAIRKKNPVHPTGQGTGLSIHADYLSKSIAACNRHARGRPISNEVYVGLTEDRSLAARALVFNELDILLISASVPSVTRRLYSTLLSYESVRGLIGIRGGIAVPSVSRELTAIRLDSDEQTTAREHDPETLACIDVLTDIISYYFVYHEYCHLMSGHVRLLQSITGPDAFMSEHPVQVSDLSLALKSRTLEYDADSFALIQTMDQMRNLDLWRSSREAARIFRHPFIKATALTLAIYGLFAYQETVGSLSSSYELRSHPLPTWRAQMAVGAVETTYQQDYALPMGTFSKNVHRPVLHVLSRLFLSLTGASFFSDQTVEFYRNPSEINSFYTCWREMRPDLEKFKLAAGYRLAPDQALPDYIVASFRTLDGPEAA